MAKKRKRRRRAPPPKQAAGAGAAVAESEPEAPARVARRRRSPDGPPPAPWGSFPLVELVVFVGLVLMVIGFLTSGDQGLVMIVTGLLLASLGGLELAIREHFSGYRSHTLVLAGVAAVVCLFALFFLAPELLSPALRVGVALAVFALAAWGLTVVFRRRSGGLAFRIKGFRG